MRTPALSRDWPARRAIGAAIAAAATVWSAAAGAQGLYWPDSRDFHVRDPRFYESPVAPDDLPRPRRKPRLPPMPMADKRAEKLAAEGPKPQAPVVVAISIADQAMKVYDGNGLFAETPISSGMTGHSTPMGVFSVIQKSKWHRSNIYSDAPMPYMQRLTWSGIAMHAGVLPGYPASHGCVRMPTAFAVKMWHWTRMGARVIVTPGDVTPVTIDHAFLAALKPRAPATPVAAAPADPAKDAARVEAMPGLPVAAGTKTADASAAAIITDKPPEVAKPAGASKRNGALHLFVSRKDGKLYVRQNFAPLLELPIAVQDDKPLGTHVFTARRDGDDTKPLHWTVMTLPTSARLPDGGLVTAKRRKVAAIAVPAIDMPPPAGAALDRLKLADADLATLQAAMGDAFVTGSSLIVSDQGLAGGETGDGTDFIVRLR